MVVAGGCWCCLLVLCLVRLCFTAAAVFVVFFFITVEIVTFVFAGPPSFSTLPHRTGFSCLDRLQAS